MWWRRHNWETAKELDDIIQDCEYLVFTKTITRKEFEKYYGKQN